VAERVAEVLAFRVTTSNRSLGEFFAIQSRACVVK